MKPLSELRLADIISCHVVFIAPDAPLDEAARLMGERHISCLVVGASDAPQGILTERDLVRLLHAETPGETAVLQVMTAPVLSAPVDTDFRAAFALMRRQNIRHLLALEATGGVAGVASETDFRTHLGLSIFHRVGNLQAVMDPSLCILPPETALNTAVGRMLEERRDYLLVGHGEVPQGILTERDIPRLSAQHADLAHLTLGEVMSSPLQTIPLDAPAIEVARCMADRHLRHLVVVYPDGRASGVISQHRLMLHLGDGIFDDAFNEAERWRAEMKRIEEQLELVLDAAGYGVWEYDHVRDEVVSSPILCELLQMPPERIKRLPDWIERIHPDDWAGVATRIEATLSGREPHFEAQYRFLRGDGHWRWFESRGRMVRDDRQGQPPRLIGVASDITPQKHHDELLRLQNEFARLAGEAADRDALYDGIVATALALPDLDGGGLYLREADGGYRLIRHCGLSARFIAATAHHSPDSPQAQWVEHGEQQCACKRPGPACTRPEMLLQPAVVAEGILSLVVLPILRNGRPIACLNLASRHLDQLDPVAVAGMQTLARQFGMALQHHLDAEETLHQRDNLDHLFAALDDYLFVLDMQGNVIHCNRAVEEGLGYGRRLIGQPVALVHPAEVRDEAMRVVGEMLAGKRKHCPLPIEKADGSRIMVDTRIVRGNWNGQPALIGISRDITELEAQRQALELERAHLATLVNTIPDLIWLKDPDGAYLACNPEFERFFGAAASDILGKTDYDFMSGELAEFFRGHDRAAMAAGKPTRNEEWITYASDGRRVLLETTKMPMRTPDGRLVGVLGIGHDITASRQADASLQAFSRDFEAFLDQTTDFIYFKDADSRIRFCSQTLADVTGHSNWREMLGKHDREIFPPDIAKIYEDEEAPVFSEGRPLLGKVDPYYDAQGGTGHVLTNKWPLFDSDGKVVGIFGISRDITERMRAEAELDTYRHHLEQLVATRTAELVAAKDAAEAASRAKSTFLANMSHELRTPMNGVMGMVDMALRRATDPQQIDWLNKSKSSAHHLLAVINDILDISKIEANRLTLESVSFRFGEVLENLISLLGHKAQEKQIKLLVDLEPEFPRMAFLGDPLRLGQILLNLAGNALKFTDHGSITVRVRLLEDSPEGVLLRIEVTDTGIGISPEDQKRLFTAFEQADGSMTRKYGGTGLGLVISKRLVHLMGGEIGVTSTPGQGSTFWFTVRLGKSTDAVSPAPTFSGKSADERLLDKYAGTRILLAEDEPINQEVSRGLLEDAGLIVDLAEDGLQALAMAKQNTYALILMDMQMPHMNGVEATLAIRALPAYAQTPILAMTANAFDEDRQVCLDAGMNDHIGKPVDPERLYQTLLAWLDKRGN